VYKILATCLGEVRSGEHLNLSAEDVTKG